MKISRLRYNLSAIALACTLSITGIGNTQTIVKAEELEENLIVRDEIEIPNDELSQKYLQKEYEYYKANPNALEEDAQKYEIVIDPRGRTYRELVSEKIKDIENEFGDIAYISTHSTGNEASTGDREIIQPIYESWQIEAWHPVAIVGVKSDREYPFAVAEYDEETNTIGEIIGWYKDEDIRSHYYEYADVIEMPVSKYVSYGNIDSFDIDENFEMCNFMYRLPGGYGYTSLVENNRYGIRIDYTSEGKEGYYSWSNSGIYVPIEDREEVRGKLDEKNLELTKKFGIKNN